MAFDPARAKEVFLEAAALDDPAAREAVLVERCGADAALLARVRALLESDARARAAVATVDFGTVAEASTANYPGKDEHAGAVIAGKYTLVDAIGEGGMGSVWRAKQTEPVKRFVAVKLIKAGMDSKTVLARFEAERQALALMDHPNIAKVLDGGLHDHRPFFVMELVKGVPITEYCDHCKLNPKARLELFVQVCQAIQHAHQKGIIHRDIKPNNVLIALYDDKPVVKVIDFGVAKATGGALTDKTLDTGFGAVVGTPSYMSPEQATFNNLDIDTRSDVYALGVLLYELLTGTTPFSRKELEKRGLLEILRVVREEEPPRPSTKLSTADALPSLSANRGTEPKKLTGLLRNELDWIVMKALEKDRTRRYETANGFATDVQRYLSGEAVQAHPPSRGYRLKKFVRRNKGQVVAASLVFFALLGGVIGTTWQAIRAEIARADEADQRKKAEDQEQEAKAAEAKAVQASESAKASEVRAKASEARAKSARDNADQLLDMQTWLASGSNKHTPDQLATLQGLAAQFEAVANGGTGPDAAEAFTRLAVVHELLNNEAERDKSRERALRLWIDLARTDPANANEYRLQVAKVRGKLAEKFAYKPPPDPKHVEMLRLVAADWKSVTDGDPASVDALVARATLLQSLGHAVCPSVAAPLTQPPEKVAEKAALDREAEACMAKAVELRSNDPVLTAAYLRRFGQATATAPPDYRVQVIRDHLRAAVRFPDFALRRKYSPSSYGILDRDRETFDSLLFDRIARQRWQPGNSDVLEFKSGELKMARDCSPEELVRILIADPCQEALKEFPDYKYAAGLKLLLTIRAMSAVGYANLAALKPGERPPEPTGEQLRRRNELFAEAIALARQPGTRLPEGFVSFQISSKDSPDPAPRKANPLTAEEYVWWHRLGSFGKTSDATVLELKREFARKDWRPTPMFCLRVASAALPGSQDDVNALPKDQLIARWELGNDSFARFVAALPPDDSFTKWDIEHAAYWHRPCAEMFAKRFRELGDHARVRSALSVCLKFGRPDSPGRIELLHDLGNASLNLGDWAAALADYRECVKSTAAAALKYDQRMRHFVAVARFRSGAALLRLTKYDEAEKEFDAALDLRRGEPNRLPMLRSGKPAVPWNVPVTERDRAKEYALNARWDDARKWARQGLKTLDENEEAYAPVGARELRITLLSVAARSGDRANVIPRLEALAKADALTGPDLYNLACVFSNCSVGHGVEKADSTADQDRAMALLTKAVAAGYANAAEMKADTDLIPLRGRDDFTKLLAGLEKPKATPPPKRISPAQAAASVGHEVILEMVVRSVGFSKNGDWMYLNSAADSKDAANVAVAVRNPMPGRRKAMRLDREPNAIVGTRVVATGKLAQYKDAPQLLVESPEQVTAGHELAPPPKAVK